MPTNKGFEFLKSHEIKELKPHFLSNSLKNTMFYVCQGSCLCGTVNNRGKVIYCYGDLVPRGGDMVMGDGANPPGATSSKDLLTAQLGVWTFGIVAL